ncbi:hypothetical protein I302_103505 [Kwoniella bestiolae CBS 10118]|uniref:Uncharacterized protein n=1 Tax=Kwoniella bestiolae CBS 10118 TaxID=1296100 RepID=A0A1B9G8M2_9TREE|nr:hypothetical protein I302_02207 [Kwoniella bestiolae CBS 10118]OCF27366.1 hypothetical protein I302_02207 [Kwoniella bestiolae CBS 10118]
MPSSSKIIAISLIAGASAAPLNLFGTASGKASTSVSAGASANAATNAVTDITGFTNAFLSSATGGAITTVSKLENQLGSAVGVARTIAMNTWASGQCLATYADINMCTELSAYLSAVYYAFEQGWSAAQLFAALGADRVNQFQSLISSLCAHAEASSTCSPLLAAWPSYLTAMAQVDANIVHQASSQLVANGIITLIDAAHTGIHLVGGLTSGVMANANAMVGASTNGILGLHLRDEHEQAKRFLGLENLFGHKDVAASATATVGAAAQAAASATATAAAQAQAQAAGALNIANIVNAAGSLTAGTAAQAAAGAQAGAAGSANLITGLTSNIPIVGGLVDGLPIVGGVVNTVGGIVNKVPIVGGVAQTATGLAAGLTGQAAGSLGAATNLVGGVGIPGLLSLNGQVSGAANAAAAAAGNVAATGQGVLGTATNLLGLRDIDLAAEIVEGDVFAHLSHEHKRDLLSGLLSNPTGILNNVPVVGGLTNGLLGGLTGGLLNNPTGAVGSILNNPTGAAGGIVNTVNHLPVVGPIVGNTVNTALNTVNSVLNTVGHLPVVGNVAAQATGALNSATNAGLNIGKDGLQLGLNDVTSAAGGIAGQAGLHLKRGLLDGLPLLGALPVGNIVNGLPIVNNLPIGGILSNPVGTVQQTVNNLPIVGGLVHGLTANLPIVGGLTAQAGAQAQGAANAGLNLGAGGLSATLDGVTSAIGNIAGSTGVKLGARDVEERDLLGGLLGGVTGTASQTQGLIGNNLPIVGPLVNGLTSNLPIVGNAGGLLSGVTNTVGQLTGTVGNTVSGLTHNLPIVGNLVDGLTHSLPLIGAAAQASANGAASSATNAALNLGSNGLQGTLNSVTGLAGGLLGGANLHLKREASPEPILGINLPIVSSLPVVNSLPIVGNGQVSADLLNGLNVQLGPVQAQANAAIQATQHGLSSVLGAGLKVGDLLNAQTQSVVGALIH